MPYRVTRLHRPRAMATAMNPVVGWQALHDDGFSKHLLNLSILRHATVPTDWLSRITTFPVRCCQRIGSRLLNRPFALRLTSRSPRDMSTTPGSAGRKAHGPPASDPPTYLTSQCLFMTRML